MLNTRIIPMTAKPIYLDANLILRPVNKASRGSSSFITVSNNQIAPRSSGVTHHRVAAARMVIKAASKRKK
jgi:hypothetical protein